MAYSGGKDSSYTLKLLRERYDLKILAFTLDNHFVSPVAWKNIDAITDILTGTPTPLSNFKEQLIDCYAKINGQTIDSSQYYSGGKVVSTDPVPYKFTAGALWWYNELNFTITTVGTIQNIYDGDHNGIDDGDVAKYGIFGRQINTKGAPL